MGDPFRDPFAGHSRDRASGSRPVPSATRRSDSLRMEQGKIRKVAAEVTAVHRRQAVRLYLGMGRDKKVGNQMLARTTRLTVLPEELAGQERARLAQTVVGDSRLIEAGVQVLDGGEAWCQFSVNHWADDQDAFASGPDQAFEPFRSGVFPVEDRVED